MANTAAIYARIDKELKDNAEEILSKLGITPTGAITMLYSQIVLRQGIPFDLRLPPEHPLDESKLTREELEAELRKGIDSIEKYGTTPAREVEERLKRKLGI